MDTGERIEAWCEAKGVTFEDVANAAGVTVAAVYQWVGTGKSKTKPALRHLESVVKFLKLTMEEFYGPIPKSKRAS